MTEMIFFIWVVIFDFVTRAFRKESFSPFGTVAKCIVSIWHIKPHYTDESPKRFALYLGLGMTTFVLLFALVGLMKTAVAIALILIICAFLEVLFDFCIGCKLYYLQQLVKGI
jgi:hypothetical protein